MIEKLFGLVLIELVLYALMSFWDKKHREMYKRLVVVSLVLTFVYYVSS